VYLIKICNNLIEEPETLQPLLINVRFCVKFLEVWDGREHHTHQIVRLMVEVLSKIQQTKIYLVRKMTNKLQKKKVYTFGKLNI